ncbi:MAG: polysaccharide biosynthesis/export family protein [Planctomycetota bacterium]|nr:polysaccharide biosynthesis/export family protein [Planctomycetota bacterium]
MGPTAAFSTLRSWPRRSGGRAFVLLGTAGLSAAILAGLGGCTADLDTYFDPSKVIRAEATPTSVPILDRIAAIEGPADQYVEHDTIRPDDLRPEASEYRIGPGDTLEVRIWDIISPNQVEIYPMLVDTRGAITIPQLGELDVNGLTAEQARQVVADATASLVNDPLVQVTVAQSRNQTFTIFGAVAAAGTYYVPTADYRLLEAITTAGGIAETIPYLYVIRQIPLDQQPTNPGTSSAPTGDSQPQGEGFIDLLDTLTGDDGGSPAVIGSSNSTTTTASWQPEQPAIDLIEGNAAPAADPTMSETNSAWIFVNGEWVRTVRTSSNTDQMDAGSLMTQRVIKVDTRPLLSGDARYNIVIRPGDVIRIPPSQQGFVYLEGEVGRPGSYTLPAVGPYTLRRAIASASGLSSLGIPERCDLTRMIGENRQATIMLNYRAIVEGTQPDVVLKPNDIISMGTTFWAYPLAVLRNGFRASYGFGFLLDRNFGNDVFGAPPTNITGR